MPVIRFEPQAPSRQTSPGYKLTTERGEAEKERGQGIAALGNTIFNVGFDYLKQQRELEAKTRAAEEKALAHERANALTTDVLAGLDDLKQQTQKAGTESLYRQSALDYINVFRDNAKSVYKEAGGGNDVLFSTLAEEALQPIRAGVVKESRQLIVNKSLRELSTKVDSFVRKADGGFEDIDDQFRKLLNRADEMEQDLVIDRKGKVDVLEGAAVEMLKRRQRFLLESDPDHATERTHAEVQHFNNYLSPLFAEKLRDATEKGEDAFKQEKERQLITLLTHGGVPLDDVLPEAARLKLDTEKIERAWSEHANRKYTYLDHLRTTDERVFSRRSDALRTDLTLRASKDKSFDLRAAVETNQREMTGDDTRALLALAKANDEALNSASASEPETLRDLKRRVYDRPESPSTEQAIFQAVHEHTLSKPDYEQLLDKMHTHRKELRNDVVQRRHQVYTEGQRDLEDALKTTSPLEFDPVANRTRDAYAARLRAAMFGPEQRTGDKVAFETDPLAFISRLKTESRAEMEGNVAKEALSTLRSTPALINTETGLLNLEAVRIGRKEGILTNLEAERVFFLDQLVKQGVVQWPFKPAPAPPPAPPVVDEGILDSLRKFFSSEAKADSEKKSDRKATRERNF